MKHFLIPLLLTASSLSFADDEINVTDPNSHAWKNTLHACHMLDRTGYGELSQYLMERLLDHDIYYEPYLTNWKKQKLNGCINGLTDNMTFDDLIISSSREVSLLTTEDEQGITAAAKYLNTAIHEITHYKEFKDGLFSSEHTTYASSMRVYVKIAGYLLERYRQAKMTNDPNVDVWRRRAQLYAFETYAELQSFSPEKFGGEIEEPFEPLAQHKGCVRPLTRKEAANYFLDLELELLSDKPFDELFDRFDRNARFLYGMETPECLKKETFTPIAATDLAVGFGGLRLRQKMYRLEDMPAGQILKITISGSKQRKVEITLAEEKRAESPFGLSVIGRVDNFHNVSMISVPSEPKKPSLVLIINENQAGQFPQNESEFKIVLTRVWFDENNVRHESPLTKTVEIPSQAEAIYGYHTTRTRTRLIELTDANAYYDPQDLERQIVGVRFYARKGNVFRTFIPYFDGRLAVAYQLISEPGNPLKKLKPLSYLNEGVESTEFEAHEDMEIFLLVSRLFNQKQRRDFEIQVETTSKIPTIYPPDVDLMRLEGADLNQIGAHRMSGATIEVDWFKEQNPAGFAWYAMKNGGNPFAEFKLIDLNVKKGDLVLIRNNGNKPPLYVVTYKNNRYETIGYYSGLTHTQYRIQQDTPHYVLLEDLSYAPMPPIQNIEIEYKRASNEGPWGINPHLLTAEEVNQRFGLTPVLEKLFADYRFDETSPKGFIFKDSSFQLFEVQVNRPGRVKTFKPLGSTHRVIFGKINQDLWNQNLPSIEYLTFHTEYSTDEQWRDIQAGTYVLAVESPYLQEINEAPFRIRFSAGMNSNATLDVKPMSLPQMLDPRMRMKK